MENERFATLVTRLLEGTRIGKIKWEEESSNSFHTLVGQHIVYIAEHDDPTGDFFSDPDYSVGIRRMPKDQWVDSCTDEELKDALPGSFKVMQALYREARRNARGVDDILDEVLKNIG